MINFFHTMVRVTDLDRSLKFFCGTLGLREVRRWTSEKGRFTVVHVGAPDDPETLTIELTHNWDPEILTSGRNFGHIAFVVDDIYEMCERIMKDGVTINRPPRDGNLAFIHTPDGVSIEIRQRGGAKPPVEPWTSMPNVGTW